MACHAGIFHIRFKRIANAKVVKAGLESLSLNASNFARDWLNSRLYFSEVGDLRLYQALFVLFFDFPLVLV